MKNESLQHDFFQKKKEMAKCTKKSVNIYSSDDG